MPIKIKGTRLVYFPVPKIACTSLKTAIYHHNVALDPSSAIDGGPDETKFDVHKRFRSEQFRLSYSVRYGIGREWLCMVREPLKRFVSGYRNRILHHGDLGKPGNPIFEREGLPSRPDIDDFALNIGRYVAHFRPVRHHFSPICRYLGEKPGRFAKVFDISQMDELVAFVAANGAELEVPHEQAGGPKMSVADMSEDAKEAVRLFYAQDYRIWGSYF